MDVIIELKDVTFQYEAFEGEEAKQLLTNYSLSIEKGSFVAVLGHNASGKSTVAKLMNGLNKPISGKVFVNGIDTTNEDTEIEVRRTVGMVFQNPDNQLVSTIVEEDVAFGPENLGVPREEIIQRVEDSLRAVDMLEYREHAPHKLSGGQKQRIAIAGVIAMQPECIVFDEPTAMLDPRGRSEVMDTIKKLNTQKGITIVLITHYMDEAAMAGRVVVMDKGKIIADGKPRDIFTKAEMLKGCGLDVPQPTELMYELKKAGLPYKEEILTAEECVEALSEILTESTR